MDAYILDVRSKSHLVANIQFPNAHIIVEFARIQVLQGRILLHIPKTDYRSSPT